MTTDTIQTAVECPICKRRVRTLYVVQHPASQMACARCALDCVSHGVKHLSHILPLLTEVLDRHLYKFTV